MVDDIKFNNFNMTISLDSVNKKASLQNAGGSTTWTLIRISRINPALDRKSKFFAGEIRRTILRVRCSSFLRSASNPFFLRLPST